MNAIPPLRPDQPVTITLPAARWNDVIEGVTFLPYRVAAPLIAEMHEQVQRAPLEAAIRATEDASATGEGGDPAPAVSEDMPPHPADIG